ncbi:MAG: cytochrome C [Acidobacteria bacterium]|nr:MAG: cytochrome C [Acidobacteriota bacterium]
MLDPNFALIVKKPDNVPIVAMLFLVGFFLWLSMAQAYDNDDRIAAGQPPKEASDGEAEKTWVWPDLVYTELLAMVIGMIILVVWSLLLKAPIEEPANPARTPNPSKAPWYFLGLQEMLVYFDPWLAGVVFPSLIIVGLMAIPYIDTNPKGNGYFTFKERKVEITLFLFGFLILWVLLVTLGTFLRGPNWNFFGPYEYWDLHKLLALNNVNLSEYFWVKLLHMKLPSGTIGKFVRELPGILIVVFYIGILPGILAMTRKTWTFKVGSRTFSMTFGLRKYFEKLGPWRFSIFVMLLLCMIALPIKMVLRWTLNLKYIISLPEIFFNI